MPRSYLSSASIRMKHIPQGVSRCVGWTQLPPAWRWVKCMAPLCVLSAELNTERVITQAQSGQLYFAGRHKVPLAA